MNPAPPAPILVRLPPALAGGPLEHLNRLLLALAEARRRPGPDGRPARVELLLDAAPPPTAAPRLLLLNESGDPVTLAGPPGGVFDAESRLRLLEAALDTLPETASGRAVLERLLPSPGLGLREAAAFLWRDLLGSAGLEGVARAPGEVSPEPAALRREITWLGPRQENALRELGLSPALALEGEAALRKAAAEGAGREILARGRELRSAALLAGAELERLAEKEDPRLFGAAARLRRDLGSTWGTFLRRIERQARNRRGIRGARLHRLAQALRPLGEPQGKRLSLPVAAALWELDLDRLEEQAAFLAEDPGEGGLLLSTRCPGSGQLPG
ncbi:MAG: hypothetical protein ACE5H3_05260 [Planctomycetota bacterium]